MNQSDTVIDSDSDSSVCTCLECTGYGKYSVAYLKRQSKEAKSYNRSMAKLNMEAIFKLKQELKDLEDRTYIVKERINLLEEERNEQLKHS